jgi:hypothetical protein
MWFRAAGVLGVDVSGDEGSFPLSLHTQALHAAKRLSVPVTVTSSPLLHTVAAYGHLQ